MASNNPFADDYDPNLPARPPPAGPPEVPFHGGNPFEGSPRAQHAATPVEKVADTANAASNTFSMGITDRLRGVQNYLTGAAPSYSEGVDQARADSAARRERSPYLSVAGDVAGGTAQAFVPGAGVIGRTAGAALGGAGVGARAAAARMAGYGLEGGVLGAAQSAGHTYSENPQDYANNALKGGAFSAALGAPFGKFADVAPRSTAKIPNSQQLKDSASNMYTQTHTVPISYPAPHYWSGVDALEQQLMSGPNATNQVKSPAVWEALKIAREGRALANKTPGGQHSTIEPQHIDNIRQQLTGVKEPGAYTARNWLDDYMQTAPTVKGGQPERDRIALLLSNARGDYRAGKRTQTIEEQNQFAADRAEAANSGKNVANTYASKLTNLLNPKSSEGKWYTPAEKADIRGTARLDDVERFKRTLGNMMAGGGGIGAGGMGVTGLGAGYMTGDLIPALAGVGIPAAGMALKSSSNRNMVSAAEALADRMAMNSPLYRHRAANAPVVAGPGLSNTAEASRNAVTNQVLEQLRIRGAMDPEEK